MIDVEAEVYDPIAKALRQQFPGINVVSEPLTSLPKKFPCVALVEMDNYSPKEKIDSSGEEKFSNLTWHLTVYSDKAGTKKSECRKIFGFVDSLMFGKGFTRESGTPEVPINSNSIYWMSSRYVAQTDGEYLYRI